MTLFDYLPRDSLVLALEGIDDAAAQFWAEIAERHEQGRHDYERPLLPPETVFVAPEEIGRGLDACRLARLQAFATGEEREDEIDFALQAPPRLAAPPRRGSPSVRSANSSTASTAAPCWWWRRRVGARR